MRRQIDDPTKYAASRIEREVLWLFPDTTQLNEHLVNDSAVQFIFLSKGEWLHYMIPAAGMREAFASGRPVIATKVGDIPEIVRHRENGLLIEPGNTRALASAILEFISDPELAGCCVANGFRYATENFSFDKMMDAKLRADAFVVGAAAR